jgi:hypothetical protein
LVLEKLPKTMKNGFNTNTNKINKNTSKKTTTNKQLTKPNSRHVMTGTAIFIAAILIISGTNIKAFADNVQNDVVAGGNDTITSGGSTTISYRITANNGDGQNGCNPADTSPAKVIINAPGAVTRTPGSLTFTSCGTNQGVAFSSSTPGDYLITVSVLDPGTGTYNVNPATFTLHVKQPAVTIPVMLNLPANQVIEATSGQGAVATFTEPTASDQQGPLSVTCTHQSGSTFPLGTTTVSCSATNSAGTTTQSFTITVRDTNAPAFTVPSNVVAEATGPSGAAVPLTLPTTATDAVSGEVPVTCDYASGDTFPIGETTVTCSATDGTNPVQGSFVVRVVDTTPPTLDLPTNPTIKEATSSSGAAVTYTATANDLVAGVVDVDCNPASGETFGLGDTTVLCSATDGTNPAQGSFVVRVVDTTPPTLDLPSGIQAIATSSSGKAVTYTATANDLVAGVVNVDCNPASGETFPLKTTTVLCSATDGTNAAQGSFVVTVTFPQWSGILQPINKEGDSIFKLGSTVPVKFQIAIPGGGYITDATAKLLVAKVSSNLVGDEVEAITSTPASSGNNFRYDSASNQYIYNLGTKTGYTAGTWQLRIDLQDGSTNTVLISLRK